MNIKLSLFNLRNNLRIDQLNESKICSLYLENFDSLSEVEINEGLKKDLHSYTYDPSVVSFLESVHEEIGSKPLVYDLKDLYKKVERKNHGELYRPSLVTLLEIINLDGDEQRMEAIVNNLSIYDWIPEVKGYLAKLSKNPMEIQNITRNGKGHNVYTIAEKVEEGSIVYVGDRWFLVNEKEIKPVVADEYIKSDDKIREIRILEQIMKIADINSDKISYKIDEYLNIGISSKDGSIYLNDEKLDKETTLEAIFNTPVISPLKKNYYILCETNRLNIDKFMDFDIALKLEHPLKPHLEAFCFNYKNNNYLYTIDKRTGSNFYQFESVTELIHDIQREFDFDISYFFENKLSTELKQLRTLEEKEKTIEIKLKDVNESIDMLSEQQELLNESTDLRNVFNLLLLEKHNLQKELSIIRNDKISTRKSMVK